MKLIETAIIVLILFALFAIPLLVIKKLQKDGLIFSANGIPTRALILIQALFFTTFTGLYLLNEFIMHIEFSQYRFVNLALMFMGVALTIIIQFYYYLVVMNQKGIRGFRWKIKYDLIFSVNAIPARAVTLIWSLYFATITALYLLNEFIMNIEFSQYRFVILTLMFMSFGLATIIQFYNYLVVMDEKGIRGFRWKIKWSEIDGYSIDRERAELVIKGSKQRVIDKIRKANWPEVEKMLVERVGHA